MDHCSILSLSLSHFGRLRLFVSHTSTGGPTSITSQTTCGGSGWVMVRDGNLDMQMMKLEYRNAELDQYQWRGRPNSAETFHPSASSSFYPPPHPFILPRRIFNCSSPSVQAESRAPKFKFHPPSLPSWREKAGESRAISLSLFLPRFFLRISFGMPSILLRVLRLRRPVFQTGCNFFPGR